MTILDAFRLDGKVALVTGGNRGLGQAMALGLAEAGADIVNLNRGADPGEVREQVEALGRRFAHIQCDLSAASVEQLQAVVQQVVDEMGRLDILVNNAGNIPRTPAIDYNEADWDSVIQIHLKAGFFLSQAAARAMKETGGGKIILMGSVLSFQGGIWVPSYAAAKHGLAGLGKALANEWSRYNININTIAPGYIETDVTEALRTDPSRAEALLARVPMERWGHPDDLKGLTVFLASPASDFVQGTVIPVDGGWMGR
ncbi:MAG: SDR family NAD(P)-dependent oxidoreductase [Chloroflexota bacterium]